MIDQLQQDRLSWMPECGIGYYPVKAAPYDASYFDRIKANSQTEIGKTLNACRLALVAKYLEPTDYALDIGIGCGAFVEARGNTYGYDINPKAVEWLADMGLYRTPYHSIHAMTFWDSLEHIHDPSQILANVQAYAFVSMPIYRSLEHLMTSKHRRYDEHCWYFTHDGIKIFMAAFGFDMVEHNLMETHAGREDIGTYVFKRRA